ncbi:hypothetical protein BC828DRAFT_371586 [Blastocladiella britannica]|nr:hypothetical protein BC828DRAFT_371586 [Blastocladiella britannica]
MQPVRRTRQSTSNAARATRAAASAGDAMDIGPPTTSTIGMAATRGAEDLALSSDPDYSDYVDDPEDVDFDDMDDDDGGRPSRAQATAAAAAGRSNKPGARDYSSDDDEGHTGAARTARALAAVRRTAPPVEEPPSFELTSPTVQELLFRGNPAQLLAFQERMSALTTADATLTSGRSVHADRVPVNDMEAGRGAQPHRRRPAAAATGSTPAPAPATGAVSIPSQTVTVPRPRARRSGAPAAASAAHSAPATTVTSPPPQTRSQPRQQRQQQPATQPEPQPAVPFVVREVPGPTTPYVYPDDPDSEAEMSESDGSGAEDDHEGDSDEDGMNDPSDQAEFEAMRREALRATSGVGARKVRHRRGTGRRRIDPNASDPRVRELVDQAYERFAFEDTAGARQAAQQALVLQPFADRAYRILALIYEIEGNTRGALTLYMTMASMSGRRDYRVWRQCAAVARLHGTYAERLLCWRRAASADPLDTLMPWRLITEYEARGVVSTQVDVYKHLLQRLPHNMFLMRRFTGILLEKHAGNDPPYTEEMATMWTHALEYHAKGSFCHPWVPPTEQDMDEVITHGGQNMFMGVRFHRRRARASVVPVTAETGGCTLSDLETGIEALCAVKHYAKLADIIKDVLRYLQGRVAETEQWHVASTAAASAVATLGDIDDEYDPVKNPRDSLLPPEQVADSGSGMPLRVRVFLGVCRIHQGYVEAAARHFAIFSEQAPFPASEGLYHVIWQAYMDADHHALGLKCMETMLADADAPSPQSVALVHLKRGKCYMAMGAAHESAAMAAMMQARALDPELVDPCEHLAEMYITRGEREQAFDMLTEAEMLFSNEDANRVLFSRRADHRGIRARQRRHSTVDTASSMGGTPGPGGAAGQPLLFDKAAPASSERQRLMRRGDRMRALAQKEREIKANFAKLNLVGDAFVSLNAPRRCSYLATGQALFETFRNTPSFYPSDRTVTYAGVDQSGRIRNTKMANAKFVDNVEYQEVGRRVVLAPRSKYDPEDLANLAQDEHLILIANHYMSHSMDEWFDQLLRYCISLVINYQSRTGFDALDVISQANVFWQDADKMIQMHLMGVSMAVASGNSSQAVHHCRWLITNYPYHSNVYRIYCAAMCSGTLDRLEFASSNLQKYFRRQLQMRFAGPLRKHMTPQEVELYGLNPNVPVKDEPEKVWAAKPLLQTLYGHILICGSSFLPAFVHYIRAFAYAPDDPMVNMMLGIAQLHRAMQRKTDNRHLQVAQGVAFMFRYVERAEGKQPKSLIYYNVARGFHQIGLVSLATRYYRMALDEGATDPQAASFRRTAAYNLCLIYVASNSMSLARQVVEEHLTV